MKQLHKSSPTHAPSPAHAPAPKAAKPARPGPRSWIGYLLREQRLLFVLLGALIASTFFLLRPYLSLSPSSHLPDARPLFSFAARSGVPAGFRPPPRRVVVTGGAGFVGSHLVDRLLEQGDSVIVVDNFFTGRKENVAHHLRNPRFELLRHDVVEPILLEVDRIYHLACPASPVHYKYNPIKTIISFIPDLHLLLYKTNVMGTLNMLGLAKRIGARFLLTSTSEVYGDPLEHPQKETYWGHVNPIGVRSCYDEGKRTAETLTMDYHRGGGVEVRIARIFNTYGPRMCLDDGRVVSNFVAQALRRQPMTVYGDGKQTRSFQYVSDLVVKETIDPMATIEFKPNTADDPHMRKPDITKAKQLLHWEPKVSLKEGLPLMVTDFRQRISDE
ncbi:UDP-glucuronic acid decarboxylase 1 [Dichanthelium oligosanthes]|uniref:UDP-glucuronic acid decarboxylase 1 n=1 Tax=Dichanthelium oligosanthes TaxID=888268 RepID=A0A1E5ULB8_9POAL|nr:UDP-glucuronic acid decarboxylase 1 [Dichanthelium oligosanthes]